MRYARVSALLMVAATSALGAQSPTVDSAIHVRVWSAQSRFAYTGTLSSVASDSVTIVSNGTLIHAPIAWYDRVEVRVPRSRGRGALRGAGLGALAGAIAGTVLFAVDMANCRPGDDMCGIAILGIPILTVIGTPVGALVGTIAPGNRWQRVEVSGARGR